MEKLRDIIEEELSGLKAVEHTDFITEYYRTAGSTGIKKVTDYCKKELENSNLDKVYLEDYILDGEKKLLGRTTYPVWEPVEVKLSIYEPFEEELVNYEDTPTCIEWFSTATPKDGVIAEVLDVGEGISIEDYKGKDVKGKIVFASGGGMNPGVRLYELAVEKFGAIGVVTDFLLGYIPGIRSRELRPDFVGLLRQPRTWNKGWSIVISGEKGKKLRNLLREGPVKLHAKVDAAYKKGKGENLIGEITGSEKPEEELFIVGHTSATKPGGNCASGPALILEVARSLKKLIDDGRIKRPKRTIKFLFVCEGMGSNAYLMKHWDDKSNIIGGICLCGVGEDQNKCRSTLLLSRTPDSVPSFLNEFCAQIQKEVCENRLLSSGHIRYGVQAYTPFSDNMSFNLAGVPCLLLYSNPNLFFHTQFMTADKMDPDVFKASGLIISETIVRAADLGQEDFHNLAHLVRVKCSKNIEEESSQVYGNLLKDISEKDTIVSTGITKIEHIHNRDLKALNSINKLDKEKSTDLLIEEIKADFTRGKILEKSYLEALVKAEEKDYKADFGWKPIKMEKVFPPGHYYPNLDISYEQWEKIFLEMKSIDPSFQEGRLRTIIQDIYIYSDGKTSLNEIVNKIGLEYGIRLDADSLEPVINSLKRAGSIK